MTTMKKHHAVVLIKGDDLSLKAAAVRDLIHEYAAGEDLSLGLDDFSTDDYDLAAAVDAAQTPPMFTSKRIVVAREIGKFGGDQVESLLTYLAGPCPTTHLILVGGGGTTSRKVLDAVKKVGELIETGVPSGKARQQWLSTQLAEAPVTLDARASKLLADHLGDDLGRLDGILEILSAVHGEGARINADALEPFLGQAGSGAPWDLTDAIDRGDVPTALDQLHRTMNAGERHPLQVMATLQAHFTKMLRLDGAGARDETEAAAALGMTGSTFPAKKSLAQTRKLGGANIRKAISLLATADLDLRGNRDVAPPLVMELLVARLSRLASARR
jgi:DNA polymerase III subunit delta